MTLRNMSSLLLLVLICSFSSGAEIVRLTNTNWDSFAPAGKEVDCILGDYVLRSDKLIAVVAQPKEGRRANLTVRDIRGALIDLTTVDQANDQLSALFPGKREFPYNKAIIKTARGKKVTLIIEAPAEGAEKPKVRVEYELEDGKNYLTIRSTFLNPHKKGIEVLLADDLRMDNVPNRTRSGIKKLFWVHDQHFKQAYALQPTDSRLKVRSTVSYSDIQYLPQKSENNSVLVSPGKSITLERRIYPGSDLLSVKGEILRDQGQAVVLQGMRFVDPDYRPFVEAEVTLLQGKEVYGSALTDSQGWVKAWLPLKLFTLKAKAHGGSSYQGVLDLLKKNAKSKVNTQIIMPKPSYVAAEITDADGKPIPCKVAFKGLEGTNSPYWGPPAARNAVVNLYYSVNGKFKVAIAPGKYEAIISYGTEYHVVRKPLTITKGKTSMLTAKLRRAFDSPGWISADFHSHSSPSGDNTADQRGRVLNLICEHIEFAPCTEHNRIDSYKPHLQALNAVHLLGTCPGIELTGSPLLLNHQNAFPLEFKPRTQDGGAPTTDEDPTTQIKRLATWGDPKLDRLVQQNHPDIGWLFFDKNGDHKPDEGFKASFPYMDVIEVHPIHTVLNMEPTRIRSARGKRYLRNNAIYNWLQLLNQGYRIPGVVNTDAHYNYHGSGGLRNYIRCDTKVPGKIDPLEIVRESKQGHIIMTNGPFLTVKLENAIPGDDLKLTSGKGNLQVTVYCPNWFDIDRVQVLVNGRPAPKLNFTRKSHGELFKKSVLRFKHQMSVQLKEDAHVIVVAVGENSTLGEIMGPMWGRQNPTAISNPIFVDVDGNGFQANKDTLGNPLPTKGGQRTR